MGTIANLAVKLTADTSDFDSGLKGAQGSAESFVNKLSKIGGAMTAGVTLPLLAIGGAAIKLSTDLNASMANIGSLGIGTERLKEMKSAIQDLSIETGQSTGDIADGMYQVVSAFGDGVDALKILRTNAKAAKAGLATLPETIGMTAAVTKAWNDTSAEAVLHVADMGLKTVELGQTTLPELATSLQGVTLMSKGLGISQEEMFAVFAAGTGVMGSAADVATKFRGAEQALMAPNANMIKAFKAMGVESGAALIKAQGLGGAFVSLQKYADSTGQTFTDLIGSVEGLQFATFMGKDGVDAYAQKFAEMQNVVGKTDEAFLAQTAGINKVGFTMEQLQNYAIVLGQKLGDALAPVLATLLDRVVPLADELVKLVDGFVKMDPATQNWAIAGFALLAALGPLLMILPGIIGAVTVLSGPVGLAILAVTALGVAWATNFGGIQEKTAAAIDAMRPYFDQLMQWIDTLTGSSMAAPKLPALPGASLGGGNKPALPGASLGGGNKPALPGASLMPSGNAVAVAGKAMESSGIVGTLDKINTSASGASIAVGGLVGWLNSLSALGNPMAEIQLAIENTKKDIAGIPARFALLIEPVMGFAPAIASLTTWIEGQKQAWTLIIDTAMDFAPAVASLTTWIELQARAWTIIFNTVMDFAPAIASLTTWIEGQKQAWTIIIGTTVNFAQAVKDWLAWAGSPEKQKAWEVEISAMWRSVSLPGMLVELVDSFADPVEISGSWYAPTLPFLWRSLQDTFDEPVMIVGSWINGALSNLWDAAQEWFNGNSLNVGVNFKPAPASAMTGGAGGGPTGGMYGGGGGGGGLYGGSGRALGGPVSSGVPYIVGERGAELFMPKTSGTIIPNDELAGMGGVTVNNYGNLNNQIDLNALAYAVAGQLKRRN